MKNINWQAVHAGFTTVLAVAVVTLTAIQSDTQGRLRQLATDALRIVEVVEKIDKDIPDGIDDDVRARTANGQRINPDDHTQIVPLEREDPRPAVTAYRPPAFRESVVADGLAGRAPMTPEQARAALAESPWQHELVFEDGEFYVVSREFLENHVDLITTPGIRYSLCDASDDQSENGGCHVCRDYAIEWSAQLKRLSGAEGFGEVLDWQGHHSYVSGFWHWKAPDGTRKFGYWVLEPQANRFIEHPNEAEHYSGTGRAHIR